MLSIIRFLYCRIIHRRNHTDLKGGRWVCFASNGDGTLCRQDRGKFVRPS